MNTFSFDFVVAGGGLSGVCCAIAAARSGLKTAILQDRPVFGGNSSSEIRVAPAGSVSFHSWSMESGIIAELLLEERASNHEKLSDGAVNSLYDLCLYNALIREPNITVFLNTSVRGVKTTEEIKPNGEKITYIQSVEACQLDCRHDLRFTAVQYADCTGDGVLAFLAGAAFMYGRDSRDTFGEHLAPEKADNVVMGSTIHFYARNVGKPVGFKPPAWAAGVPGGKGPGEGRGIDCSRKDRMSGYWWMEIGNPYHTIEDACIIRHELLSHVLGVWDYVKNTEPVCKELLREFALEWLGYVPGKRESRRIYGDIVVAENDLHGNTYWPDAVCTSGGYIDIHISGGILNPDEPAELSFIDRHYREYTLVPMHTLPLRAMYCRDIENLWMAGRHISLSRVAMAAERLQCILANIGQAVGTAAAIAAGTGIAPRQVADPKAGYIAILQQRLLKDDLFILGVKNEDEKDLAKKASVTASSQQFLDFGEPDREMHESLETKWGQVFPVTTGTIDTMSFYLYNRSDRIQEVKVLLYMLDGIWDKSMGRLAAVTAINLEPCFCGWADAGLHAGVVPWKPHRIVLEANGDVLWYRSCRQPVGTLAQYFCRGGGGCEEKNRHFPSFLPSQIELPPFEKWNERRSDRFSLSLKINPKQRPYGPESVTNGYSKPYMLPNIWISAEEEGFPAFVELGFMSAVSINCLRIIFDSDLNVQYSSMPGFWKPPQCVRDWNITAMRDGKWITVYEEEGNYQRLRVVQFDAVTTNRIRVNIFAANGCPAAHIYEIRAYMEETGG